MAKGRGRPPGQMTKRRRQVLECLMDRASDGERISLGHIMRRCALYDRSAVKRIMRDLEKMGAMN